MLKNFRITGKLAIGFGIVLALFGVAVFLSWTSLSSVQGDIDFLQDVAKQMELAVGLNDTVSWIRAGIRDLRFTEGDEEMNKLLGYVNELRSGIENGKRMYAAQPKLVSLASLPEMENILRLQLLTELFQ